jgi:hypothetical protein
LTLIDQFIMDRQHLGVGPAFVQGAPDTRSAIIERIAELLQKGVAAVPVESLLMKSRSEGSRADGQV